MAGISDRLKALGVQIGAQNIKPPPPRSPNGISQVLSGRTVQTQVGEAYLVEKTFTVGSLHGRIPLEIDAPLQVIAEWAGDPRIASMQRDCFAFIDTETTGLSGGAGTFAFLIGAGRFDGDTFHLAQFFMRDPIEEPAQLLAFEEFIAPCSALVTFNGKAFDLPLISTRFITHGWQRSFRDYPHVDLLHLARRLWRDRLPSRTLGNLEFHILGAERTEDDVPGWMIPSLYFQYLRDGDARPLKSVFYHNAMDVVSMVALFNHMAGLLARPLECNLEHGVDLLALARLFESLNDLETAARLYLAGLDHDLPQDALLEAIERLAAIHKKQGNYTQALPLWEKAAGYGQISSCEELAKYYEHHARDLPTAIYWTQQAIEIAGSPRFPLYQRHQILPELEHRMARLLKKSGSSDPPASDIIPAAR